jgi:hypothetical protein
MTTRDEAIAAGADRYYDGSTPCRKGHRSERYTNNGKCVACVRLMSARRPTKGTGRPGRPPHLGEGRSKTLAHKIARRKNMPLPKLRVADVVPLNLPLVELRYGACKYPTTESNGRHLFCGLSAMVSSAPYCQDHAEICFKPPDRFRDKKLFGDSLRAAGSITLASSSGPAAEQKAPGRRPGLLSSLNAGRRSVLRNHRTGPVEAIDQRS